MKRPKFAMRSTAVIDFGWIKTSSTSFCFTFKHLLTNLKKNVFHNIDYIQYIKLLYCSKYLTHHVIFKYKFLVLFKISANQKY